MAKKISAVKVFKKLTGLPVKEVRKAIKKGKKLAEDRKAGKIPQSFSPIMKASLKKLVKDVKVAEKDAAAAWIDADEQAKKETAKRIKQHAPSAAIPVESDKPGIARNPKPQKVVVPIAADGSIVPLKIISYHFLKLMERMAAEQGGSSAQALQDMRADIARGTV